MKFRLKIFLLLLTVSIIPILLVEIISYYDNERIITEHTLKNLKFFIEKEKENISIVINSHFTELNLISNRIALLQSIENYNNFRTTQNQEKLNEILNTLKNILDNANKISITDLNGKILASTKSAEINQNQPYERFDERKKSEQITVDFTLTNEGHPVILFSKILMIGTNQIGIIFAEFELPEIFGDINANTLGKTGEFSIAKRITENEALLIYPLIIEEGVILKRTISMERDSIPIIQAMMKNEDQFLNLANLQNEPILAVTGYIEEVEWGIAANINKSEIFTSLQFSLLVLVFVFIIISISVVLLAVFFSKTIAKPINEIVNASNQIAQGNLNVRLDIKTKDELNALSDSFNEMIESLKKKIKIEEELEDSKNQLRDERINTIGMLSAQIAHDIKNPLHTIKNSIEIIKNKHLSNEIIIREINRIDRGATRIAHQVEDVLNYINTTYANFTQVSLLKILQSTMETLKIPEQIEVTSPKNDLVVECDAEKIESVFNNILLNAIHAIGNNKGQIKIRISQKENEAIIEFENTGPNIQEDVLPRIFEPLFSTKEKGTGLGLVSCKSIIERHEGIITASSSPVIFKISIPIKH
ncbi:MAG: HAMP domain-containing histidine kinase [Nitrosopumilus sp.]|nr:HAMP domain-containing histidine kinase [Nitrosopumilus sp.]